MDKKKDIFCIEHLFFNQGLDNKDQCFFFLVTENKKGNLFCPCHFAPVIPLFTRDITQMNRLHRAAQGTRCVFQIMGTHTQNTFPFVSCLFSSASEHSSTQRVKIYREGWLEIEVKYITQSSKHCGGQMWTGGQN